MTTQISDIVVPEIFAPYMAQSTEEKSRLVQSGALARSAPLDEALVGGGITFNAPSFQDLANDADNVSSDIPANTSTPKKIGTSQEISVRLSRNQSWGSMDLSAALAGPDPLQAIGDKVGGYWARRAQAVFIASLNGVFADNTATDSGDMTHTAAAGFTASDFLAATLTMGDSMEDLAMVMVHSVIFNKMQNQNLIVYRDVTVGTEDASTAVGTAGNVPLSRGEIRIPTYLGRQVIVDDGLPTDGTNYDTWLFGTGAVAWGVGSPKVPVEADRAPAEGDGGGGETLFTRVEWAFAPVGFAYVGAAAQGGPSNITLALGGSWDRVFPERKQVKIARLISTAV